MKQKLVYQLTEDVQRNADLSRLMLMCRTEAQMVHVVCVGAGDAFINRYWPYLRTEVARNRMKLTVADVKTIEQLARERIEQATQSGEKKARKTLRTLYGDFIHDLQGGVNLKYVNLEDENDRNWYDHIRADIVFILVPDDIHINKAKPWLGRSTLILIEKPYNRDLRQAQEFENDLKSMVAHMGGDLPVTWVCPFDHYLAKIFQYEMKKTQDRLFEEIGTLIRMEFGILESGPVELWRAHSLEAGMIYDLFSHVLAMLSIELNLSSFRSDQIREIKVARHKNCPTSVDCETFASFDFWLFDYHGRRVDVKGIVGKGVGNRDEKFLNLVGEHGLISCDLGTKRSGQTWIYKEKSGGKVKRPIYRIGKGHPEFLEAILGGTYIEQPVGGLTGDIAIEILSILGAIRGRIPHGINEYDLKTDKHAIAARASKLSFS